MNEVTSNLPQSPQSDSALGTRLYFDRYGDIPLEFSAADVDSTVGFLKSRGFSDDAAILTSVILLKQAKLDQLPITELLDTLKGLKNLELSTLVGEVLNNNRTPTSTLGFKLQSTVNELQARNVVP
jgi:hypothetical protein